MQPESAFDVEADSGPQAKPLKIFSITKITFSASSTRFYTVGRA